MTVLVAGGSGYIGQATVRAPNAHGHQAVALTRNARATRRIELAQAGGGGQPVPQIFPAGLQGIGPARGAAARALTAADYGPAQPAAAMPHSDYPLQALLYSVVLHRFLRWRQPGHDPSRHLRRVRYLFLRGIWGAQTPVIGGEPCGVFSWRPPVEPMTALPDLLATGERAAWVSTLTRSGRGL
jgi:hypothetical protein